MRGLRRDRGGQSNRWLAGAGRRWTRLGTGVRLAAMPFAVALLALGVVAVRGAAQGTAGSRSGSGSAQSGQSGTQIFVPDESAGPLLQPPVITSQNRVLKATDTVIRAGIPGSGESVLWGGLPTYSSPLVPPPSPQANPVAGGPPAAPPHFPLNFAAGFQFTAYGKTYPAQFPAPTLRVNPGDTLDLTTINKLQNGKSNFKLPAGA